MKFEEFRLDFMGVGFGRTGSNWLCNCLYEHPEISIPKFNLHTEINYFPEEYEVSGIKNYLKKFKKCDFNKTVGEISTMVIMQKRSAKIIKKLFPKIKIIIYQRREEERARSVYNIKKYHDLLQVDEDDLKINQEEYIQLWIDEFGKKKVFIFDMDEPKKQKELNHLYKFLGVKNFSSEWTNKRTNSSYSKKRGNKIIQCKYPRTRRFINWMKKKLTSNKKLYYFMKRNLHFDYFYQLINHNMSG
jgi:hypothetical protein